MRHKPYPPRYGDSRELSLARQTADPVQRYYAALALQQQYRAQTEGVEFPDEFYEAGFIRMMAILDLHVSGASVEAVADRLLLQEQFVRDVVGLFGARYGRKG